MAHKKPVKTVRQEKKSLKLTGLTDKCLRKVCSYLEWEDLANLSSTCKRFPSICCEVFKERYNQDSVDAQIRVCHLFDEDKLDHYEKLFKYFGKYINKLRVEYDSTDYKDNENIHHLIMKHCSLSLVEAHFYGIEKRMRFYRILPKLTRLTLTQCHLNASVASFGYWCPNVRHLDLEMIHSVTNTSCIEQNFPKLEHFGLINFVDCNFSNKNLRRFIKCNQQLKGLRICRDVFGFAMKITSEFITFIDQMLPSLEYLNVTYMHQSLPVQKLNNGQSITKFSKVKKLTLTCRTAETVQALMIPTKNIEDLTLDIEYGASEQTLEYIMNCQNVKSLTWYLNKVDELKLVHRLSKNPMRALTSLTLYVGYGLNDNSHKRTLVLANAIDFIVHYKQLESIMIGFQLTDNVDMRSKDEEICCENCSTRCDGDQPDDDNTSLDEKKKNLEVLGTIFESFSKIVEYKSNKVWTMNYSVQKMQNKLIPVMGDVYICANFKKGIH